MVVGESSPEYMANPSACSRIAATIPDVRMIAILRNPIERAYSDYLMYRRDGDERCSRFSDALDQQDERSARQHTTGYYLSTGFYGAQLRPFFDMFPREHLHIVLYDDLRSNFPQTLSDIFAFLGVEPSFIPTDQKPVNVSGLPSTTSAAAALAVRSRLRTVLRILPQGVKLRVNRAVQKKLHHPAMDPADRARLLEIYRSDILELSRLLNRDLSHWVET